MLRKYASKLAVVLITGALAALALVGAAVPSFASTGSGYQYDSNYGYANAWGGGPYIANYSSSAVNNDFSIAPNGDYDVLYLSNGGAYAGQCIGDYGNNSGEIYAALSPCTAGGTGGGTPWGANFAVQDCDGTQGLAFYDEHWKDWLAPGGSGNGYNWVLNGSFSCLILHAPA
jgi:hypothetical protein